MKDCEHSKLLKCEDQVIAYYICPNCGELFKVPEVLEIVIVKGTNK